MQCSVLRPVVISTIQKQLARAVSVASDAAVKNDAPLKHWKEIPGPSSIPLLGPLPEFLPGGPFHNLSGRELTLKLYETYGPIVRLDPSVGKKPMVLLYDAESVSQILRGENIMPIRPGFESLEYYRKKVKKNTRGKSTGLLSEHGEKWQDFRSVVNPILLQPKTIKLYTAALDEVAIDMVNRMKSLRDKNNQIRNKLDDELNLWSVESISVVALGCRLNCLDPNLPEDSPVHKLIKCVKELIKLGDELDFKPSIWKLYATKGFKRAMQVYEEQEKLAKYFIDLAIKEFKANPKPEDEKSILQKLLEINEDYAYIMASDLLLAGVDTAANTILGTMYLLAVFPEKQAKLRKELQSNQEKRPYLKACMKEATRMMPVASGNLRRTTKEYNILGYKIPSDFQVVFAHQDMSLMDDHFLRPHEYIPERWLVDKDDPLSYKHAHPFAYSPFGFGARSCIGRRIAELEMETFIARAVENFEIKWFGQPPRVVQTSINYVKGPFNFIFNDAK